MDDEAGVLHAWPSNVVVLPFLCSCGKKSGGGAARLGGYTTPPCAAKQGRARA